MTFTEAAVEVLRLVGKPLHYKKITEIAIERNLLSHVGKTPEITMSSRLATMVKKDRGDAPITKVKPGVFGLRDFPADVLKAAEKESGHDYDLPDDGKSKGGKGDKDDKGSKEGKAASRRAKATESSGSDEDGNDGAESKGDGDGGNNGSGDGGDGKKPKRKLPGADVFPEEEDDDVPILAKLDEEPDRSEGRRSRKRRRRKRKGGGDGGGRPDSGSSSRSQPRSQSRSSSSSSPSPRASSQRSPVRGNWDRPVAEGEAVAQELADAVESVLASNNRRPMSHARVAEVLTKRGRLTGDAEALAPTVAAAVMGDEARHRIEGRQPRFRQTPGGGVALTEWDLPGDAVRAEQDARKQVERQREAVHRAFLRRLADMPATSFMQLVASWLNAEGVGALRGVRPPAKGGYHLAGTLRRGGQETRLAVVVWRDGTQVGREEVIEVRGSLHHYGQASAAWLLTTGRVQSGAREEAAVPGQAPCVLFDGAALAEAMERLGIGLRRVALPLSTMDFDLLDALSPRREDVDTTGGSERRDEPKERSRESRQSRSNDKSEDESASTDGSEDTTGDDESSSERRSDDDETRTASSGRRSRRRRGRRGSRKDDSSADSNGDDTSSEPGESNDATDAAKAGASKDTKDTKGSRGAPSGDTDSDDDDGESSAAETAASPPDADSSEKRSASANDASPEITKESDE